MPYGEERKRSMAKAATWRGTVMLTDAAVAYLLTRRVDLTLGFVILSNGANAVLYYLHERLWARSSWGGRVQDSDPHLDSNRSSSSSSSQPK